MLPVVDLVVLVTYLATVVAFGCWFVRKSSNTSEFMAAGGALPGWAVGLSIFGTYLSSNTFLGVPGKAYATNWNAFVFSLSLPIAAWIAVRYFVPFYRRAGEISAYHHFEHRFGPWARTYAVICYLLTQFARMGSILFGVSLVLAALTGWDQASIILVAGLLITLYTAMGGIEAVIWTDVVQSIILIIGAMVVLILLLFGMPEGPLQTFTLAADQDKFSLGSYAFDWTTSTFWVVLLYGMFINLNNFGIDQSFVQRYHTARDDRQAARSVWLAALLYVPISLVFFLIGTAAFTYYQTHPDMLAGVREDVAMQRLIEQDVPIAPEAVAATAAQLTDADVGDKALPHFIVHRLPVGATGLLIAAIIAAAMSSIDTSLNSSATVILSDLYKRYLRPQVGERESMVVLYTATAVMGASGIAIAIAMIGIESVLDAWWLLSGIFAGGMLGLFLLGIISRKAKNPAAVTGVVIGLLVILWTSVSPTVLSPKFSEGDIEDLPRLVQELQDQSNPAARFVFDQFNEDDRRLIDESDRAASDSKRLQVATVSQLNRLVESDASLEDSPLRGTAAYEEAQRRMAGISAARRPAWLNRLLLEASFPDALAKKPDWVIKMAPLRSPLHGNMTIVVGTLTIFFVGLIVTKLRELFAYSSVNT